MGKDCSATEWNQISAEREEDYGFVEGSGLYPSSLVVASECLKQSCPTAIELRG